VKVIQELDSDSVWKLSHPSGHRDPLVPEGKPLLEGSEVDVGRGLLVASIVGNEVSCGVVHFYRQSCKFSPEDVFYLVHVWTDSSFP